MQPNTNFLAQPEIDKITDPSFKILQNQQDYRAFLTRFLMFGLKSLGYNRSLQSLENESGCNYPRLFDDKFKQKILSHDFEGALSIISILHSTKKLTDEQTSFIEFEVIKIKYYLFLISQNTVNALKLFRSEMKLKEPHFSEQKKQLSQLYLIKDKAELITAIGFDPSVQAQLEDQLRRIEYLLLTNHKHTDQFEDAFELMCRNNLAYQLMTCKYHKPELLPEQQSQPTLTATNGHEMSLGSVPISGNHLISLQKLFLGVNHKCPAPIAPLQRIQTIEDIKDEVWRLKFNQNGTVLIASTRNRNMICWTLQGELFVQTWKTQLDAKDDVNDFSISNRKSKITIATQNCNIVILDMVSGTKITSIAKGHSDVITGIYSFERDDGFLTGGIDGLLILWNDGGEKVREVKTKRVISFSMAPNESFLMMLHSNSLMMDRVDLETQSVEANAIREKHLIVSHMIDPSSEYLLVNTSFELPEVHLWRVSDSVLLRVFTGHLQRHYSIGCAFIDSDLLCCGSENGYLYIWHVNDANPYAFEKRHNLSLNCISTVRLEGRGVLLATGSDDGQITISR